MPKDTKSRKNSERKPSEIVKGELPPKVDGTVYGQTVRILGDCNFTVLCFDGRERLCHLRKAAKKGEKVGMDTIVLVGLRDYQDDKGDIIFVYTKEQVSQLRQMKMIPSKIASSEDAGDSKEEADDTGFDFETI